MRNPIRLKNLRARFLPLYVVGLFVLLVHPPEPAGLLAALPCLVLGVAIRGWGAGHLVKNDALTMTGPYAFVRHPLYLGTLLIASGFALAVGGGLSALALVVLWPWFALVYFPRKERIESERLEMRYGERYARYREAVPPLVPTRPAFRETARGTASEGEAAAGSSWSIERYSENNELGTLLAVVTGWLVFWLRAGMVS